MIEPIHEIALASAGTGKTHRLVRRLIRLLAAPGAASVPERVLATTFTRSAAGKSVIAC